MSFLGWYLGILVMLQYWNEMILVSSSSEITTFLLCLVTQLRPED